MVCIQFLNVFFRSVHLYYRSTHYWKCRPFTVSVRFNYYFPKLPISPKKFRAFVRSVRSPEAKELRQQFFWLCGWQYDASVRAWYCQRGRATAEKVNLFQGGTIYFFQQLTLCAPFPLSLCAAIICVYLKRVFCYLYYIRH